MRIITEKDHQKNSFFSDHTLQDEYLNLVNERYTKNKTFLNFLKDNFHSKNIHEYDSLFENINILMNPKYYPLSNKEVIEDIEKTQGRNLYEGLLSFQKNSQKKLIPQLSDIDSFTLGENLATTEGKVVFQNHQMQLIHYKPLRKSQFDEPLLIVPPWINKFYIFDLEKEKSFVQYMLKKNMNVYIISWMNPTKEDKTLKFSSYIKEGIETAISYINKDVHLMGLCLGGLAATIASIRNFHNKIKSLTLLATPIDFSKLKELQGYVKKFNAEDYKKYLEEKGYQSGKELLEMFSMMRAESMILKNMVDQYYLNKKPSANSFLYWNMDSTDLPGSMQVEYIEKFFLKNDLFNGDYIMDDQKIKLDDLKIPLFVVAMEKDHIVPYQAAFAIKKFKLNCRYVFAGSGHIAGIINPPSQKKYAYQLYDENLNLIAARKYSWWGSWKNWLTSQMGELKETNYEKKGLENAPGSNALSQPYLDLYRN
jgi:polyhydroxyalkanoate synthase